MSVRRHRPPVAQAADGGALAGRLDGMFRFGEIVPRAKPMRVLEHLKLTPELIEDAIFKHAHSVMEETWPKLLEDVESLETVGYISNDSEILLAEHSYIHAIGTVSTSLRLRKTADRKYAFLSEPFHFLKIPLPFLESAR